MIADCDPIPDEPDGHGFAWMIFRRREDEYGAGAVWGLRVGFFIGVAAGWLTCIGGFFAYGWIMG